MKRVLPVVVVAALALGGAVLAGAFEGISGRGAGRQRIEFSPFALPPAGIAGVADPTAGPSPQRGATGAGEGGVSSKPVLPVGPGAIPASTAPVDVSPPLLQILHPLDGQVFLHKEVVFDGMTEPGAQVLAGQYGAEVAADGTWRILLFLFPGQNYVTFKAVDAAGNVSEAVVKPVLSVPVEDEKPEDGFTANQQFGSCDEDPPFDIFYGTGTPGTWVEVWSPYGSGGTEVGSDGHWEARVEFPDAPYGEAFTVKVKAPSGEKFYFEFLRTA